LRAAFDGHFSKAESAEMLEMFQIINNFPIESTTPPRSTLKGNLCTKETSMTVMETLLDDSDEY